ncbi:MAG: hypothetical protein ABI218_14000 [Caldimonas sp.]
MPSFIRHCAAASASGALAILLVACAAPGAGPAAMSAATSTAPYASTSASTPSATASGGSAAPRYRVDPAWPGPLPNGWILGQVSGVATDADDHVWVLQRPASLTEDERGAALSPPQSSCCRPAPPVLEFDASGRLLRSWGGPGPGYDWPQNEHGIHVDANGFVWITGNGSNDGQVLKFTRDGRFVMQIGKVGPQTGNADLSRLGQAAGVEVDAPAHEIYVADGYHNRRVIVFDSDTGAYRRHWGAFGKPPSDVDKPNTRRLAPPTAAELTQFGNPVHCVRIARDGLVYVCDRLNNRVQVFQKTGRFVREFSVESRTAGNGSVWDIVLSRDPGQRWLLMADGRNNRIHAVERESGRVAGEIGRPGRYAGEFHWVHDLAIDSKGNLYAGEVDTGKRVQKFVRLP